MTKKPADTSRTTYNTEDSEAEKKVREDNDATQILTEEEKKLDQDIGTILMLQEEPLEERLQDIKERAKIRIEAKKARNGNYAKHVRSEQMDNERSR